MSYDAIIVGGSFAGLSAAIYLARARRSVCIIDSGSPRNRFAAQSHGFFAQDGSSPGAMLSTARSQVAAYPTAAFLTGEAVAAAGALGDFSVELATGRKVRGARLVLAFGVSDELPDIPGLAERWGTTVLHCPYCHGFELSGQRLGVLGVSPMSAQQAVLISEWGPTTLYLDGGPEPEAEVRDKLLKRGVTLEPAPVRGLRGDGPGLSAVELADGRSSAVDALYLGPRTRLNSDLASQLGCAIEEGVSGPVIRTDPQQATSVAGVYAAGDITRSAHNVTWASADGVTAGLAVHRSLVF